MKTWARWARFAAASLGLTSLVAAIQKDQLECEQALSHLADCCPSFSAGALRCEHTEGCGTETEPVLSLDESRCVEGMSCSALIESGLCARVQGLSSPVFVVEDGGVLAPADAGSVHPPVCP